MGEWARSVRLFDVYAGKPLPEGKVSLAYALELGAEDRTLQDEEVEARLSAARERLRTEYGAEFRA
jgi:phenylalanyl-tRNA synthetase beta chain